MKIYALLGVVFGLVGCLGAEDIEGELGDEKIGEASGAISGLISPFANNTTYRLRVKNMSNEVPVKSMSNKLTGGVCQSFPFAECYPSPEPSPEPELIGYMFAFPGETDDGVDQEQRWVLYNSSALPLADVIFELPEPENRHETLAEWKSALTGGMSPLWKDGATYIKAKATNSPYASPDNDKIDGNKFCPYRPQLIDRAVMISRIGVDGKVVTQGMAGGGPLEQVEGTSDQMKNTETWISGPGYVAELGGDVLGLEFTVVEGNTMCTSFGFGEGSTQTTANCTYFTNLPQDL